MDPIEGIDLSTISKEASSAILEEQKEKISKQVRGIHGQILMWRGELKKVEKSITTIQEKIAKGAAKLQEIEKGNWSVLQEEKETNDPHPPL